MNCECKYFINPAIEYGIQSYINYINGNAYDKSHVFEMKVIEMLVTIYGEKAILLPYKIDNPKAFKNNLLIYDYDEDCVNIFMNNLSNYYNYIKEYKIQKKRTDLMVSIELSLLDMIKKKSSSKNINDDIYKYNMFFCEDEFLYKLRNIISSEKEKQVYNMWSEFKQYIEKADNNKGAVSLLDEQSYSKYGISINTVELLNADEIAKINEAIRNEENHSYSNLPIKEKVALTSGNGFVDVLIILSIIVTEIMIGSIVLSLVVGG